MNDMKKVGYFFFFVGRIASGKETQSRKLAEKLGYEVFTTGNRFREIIASESELGNRIKETYETGLLMPSWVANYMFEEFVFNLAHEKGAIFEGSGRDLDQANVIEEVCTWLGRPYMVLNLDVSEEEVMKRSLARARDKTDEKEVIQTRLAEYQRLTEPAINYFRSIGKCIEINGEQTPEKVHEDVMGEVDALLQ
ncbi:nucleoside monophosphate kinase [Candidatus Kaiserbacteria bacterium]|nr:nucleoside monophosphate kinase [Candidatus Kaiserbacteria bacterium]